MKPNSTYSFATKADLESLLQEVEMAESLQYTRIQLADAQDFPTVSTLLGLPDLGRANEADINLTTAYLVARSGRPMEVRRVPQRSGGLKYALDQLSNPETIVFRPGGVFGDGCLLAGAVGTASAHPESMSLLKSFRVPLLRRFSRVKSFHLGKEALALWEAGWRLTTNARSPQIYDLSRN